MIVMKFSKLVMLIVLLSVFKFSWEMRLEVKTDKESGKTQPVLRKMTEK